MHRADHGGPIPLKKGKKEKERLQWQRAPAEPLARLCATQSHPSASAAGDLQAQMIWGGLAHPHTSLSTVPCTRVAPFPTASETFWTVNYIWIGFFFSAAAMIPAIGQW